jgi:hypothetical protein
MHTKVDEKSACFNFFTVLAISISDLVKEIAHFIHVIERTENLLCCDNLGKIV